MQKNIVMTSTLHVDEVRAINRDLIEKAMQMRCLAYLSQVKAQLLTETIFEVDGSKKILKEINKSLFEQNELIAKQKSELKEQVVELETIRKELEMANSELERMNRIFVDRELRMIELKERIKELEGVMQLGSGEL